jgi:hypothetical protein
MNDRIHAPWTAEQVKVLNDFQSLRRIETLETRWRRIFRTLSKYGTLRSISDADKTWLERQGIRWQWSVWWDDDSPKSETTDGVCSAATRINQPISRDCTAIAAMIE